MILDDLLLLDCGDDQRCWATCTGHPHGRARGRYTARSRARVILQFAICPMGDGLASLKDPHCLPIDNNTARFWAGSGMIWNFGRISLTRKRRSPPSAAMGTTLFWSDAKSRHHSAAHSRGGVREPLFFEKAAQTRLLALLTSGETFGGVERFTVVNKPLRQGWKAYRGYWPRHFGIILSTLLTSLAKVAQAIAKTCRTRRT